MFLLCIITSLISNFKNQREENISCKIIFVVDRNVHLLLIWNNFDEMPCVGC